MGRKPWCLAIMAVTLVVGCQNSSGSRRTVAPAPNLSANPTVSPNTIVPRNGDIYPTGSPAGRNDHLPGYIQPRTTLPNALPANPNSPTTTGNPTSYPPMPGSPSSYPTPGGVPVQRSNYSQPTGSVPGGNSHNFGTSAIPSTTNSKITSRPGTSVNPSTEASGRTPAGKDTFSNVPAADTVPLPPLPGASSSGSIPSSVAKPNGNVPMPDKYVRTTMPAVPPPPSHTGTVPTTGGSEGSRPPFSSSSPSASSTSSGNALAVPPPPVPNNSANSEPIFPNSPPPPPVP